MNKLIQKLLDSGIKNAAQEHQWLKDSAESEQQLSTWVDDRSKGKPLAYILGHVDFFGLNLTVNEHVLIPRFETETFVELFLQHTPKHKPYHILDLGCGSGAIALAIKKHLPKCNVIGLDLSLDALNVALSNQRNYPDMHVHWVQGDWLNAINLDKIDIIISNPPYVESDWQDSSIFFEPNTALYSGKDGLDDIKKIIHQASQHPHLELWFEHGHEHDLSKIISSSWNIQKFFDHSGTQRFTHLTSKNKHV
ncbi:MAG: peptide chain release factor N(5)-glutamine methyltransferase [Gammaproteobacteria bacterium]|nr:peptide chain release factor N(5)-glutamine methyltransferase [Gammaproteobacteria bacterium]